MRRRKRKNYNKMKARNYKEKNIQRYKNMNLSTPASYTNVTNKKQKTKENNK